MNYIVYVVIFPLHLLYSKCTLHTIKAFKPSIAPEKCMMGVKSIIRNIRNIRILPMQLRRMTIGNNYSIDNTEINAISNQYGGRNMPPHLMIVPTPYSLPIIVPIYANERVVRELIKDHYYVLP